MIHVRKRFGQHFLEPAWVDKLIAKVAPAADERFLEIGPGRGADPAALAARAGAVTAVEIAGRDLAHQLRGIGISNLTVVEGDFLEPLVRRELLSLRPGDGGAAPGRRQPSAQRRFADPLRAGRSLPGRFSFADATVMLQREVADRLWPSQGPGNTAP